MSEPTEAQIDAFMAVWQEEHDFPYPPADVWDYLRDGMGEEERTRAIAEMRAEDERLERANREAVRRALRAALAAQAEPDDD